MEGEMAKIIVIADSDGGATGKMGTFVAEGARSVAGLEVVEKICDEATSEDLIAADAILLGCPTHMGSISWKMKKFIDFEFGTAWVKQLLVGKVGAVFNTAGSGAAGGSELAMIALVSNFIQNGMVFVGHERNAEGFKPEGMSWGPIWTAWGQQFEPNELQIKSAASHGKRVAELTQRLFG